MQGGNLRQEKQIYGWGQLELFELSIYFGFVLRDDQAQVPGTSLLACHIQHLGGKVHPWCVCSWDRTVSKGKQKHPHVYSETQGTLYHEASHKEGMF